VAAVEHGSATAEHPWSSSPADLMRAPAVPDLVLPSPSGAAICATAEATGAHVVVACLRNASAVAEWLIASKYGTPSRPIGVIAVGEQWPDGSLRPCVEDLVGAAAVLEELSGLSGELDGEFSVEAELVAMVGEMDLAEAVRGCVSAQELRARGYAEDVQIAAKRDVSSLVPVLRQGAFSAAPGPDEPASFVPA